MPRSVSTQKVYPLTKNCS